MIDCIFLLFIHLPGHLSSKLNPLKLLMMMTEVPLNLNSWFLHIWGRWMNSRNCLFYLWVRALFFSLPAWMLAITFCSNTSDMLTRYLYIYFPLEGFLFSLYFWINILQSSGGVLLLRRRTLEIFLPTNYFRLFKNFDSYFLPLLLRELRWKLCCFVQLLYSVHVMQ